MSATALERPRYLGLERVRATGNRQALVEQIDRVGLRGRGGAAFPTAVKWRSALEQPGPRVVVCNGGEDEPGSLKDRWLMERRPHAVIEGVLLAAYALEADTAFLYVNTTFSQALEALRGALASAADAGYATPETRVHIVEAPNEYVAGEETAALEVIEGRPPKPRRKPPYPTQSGVWGRPTVVNNVETLATVADIARGSDSAARRVLVTLGGWVEHPGVYQVELGTPVSAILETFGGGSRKRKPVKTVSPGGPSTAYLSADDLDVAFNYEALRAAGSAIGCGVVRVVPQGACMLEEVLRFAPFFAAASCGQCGPCVQGTRKIATLAEDLRWGTRDGRPLEMLVRLGQRLPGMGICGLVTGAVAAAASALALFPADFEHHARFGVCPGLGPATGPLPARRRSWLLTGPALSRGSLSARHRSRWMAVR
ncbi:MAG TPA: NADH-ubiquinone oxidoreductase-F iron-sulfur binding region domain-containing protein [Chloroflexota bacterium]